jgi:hypothetical protein
MIVLSKGGLATFFYQGSEEGLLGSFIGVLNGRERRFCKDTKKAFDDLIEECPF